MRDLCRIADLDSDELFGLLESADRAARDPSSVTRSGEGRCVAVLFEKPSLRTRFSLEAALARLGAHPIGAYDREVGLGSRESIADAARVLERYVDAIAIRTFAHARVEELAEAAEVAVVNALSDDHHPLQALADLLTLAQECAAGRIEALSGLKLAYVGDGNNVAHSLIEACALSGVELALACPDGHEPDAEVLAWAAAAGGPAEVVRDARKAVSGAHAVYTDVWASMGQEDEREARASAFADYRVTAELMAEAAPDAIFLHCLPVHRGEEVTAEVADGPASRIFRQAENRMHTAVAVFASIFGGA